MKEPFTGRWLILSKKVAKWTQWIWYSFSSKMGYDIISSIPNFHKIFKYPILRHYIRYDMKKIWKDIYRYHVCIYTKYSHQFTDRMSSLEFLFCIPRYFLSTARYFEKKLRVSVVLRDFFLDGRDVRSYAVCMCRALFCFHSVWTQNNIVTSLE